MLELFTERAESLGNDGTSLDGCISFLKQTSRIISIFQDRRPISVPSDDRLAQLMSISKWFKDWEINIMSNTSLSSKAKRSVLV